MFLSLKEENLWKTTLSKITAIHSLTLVNVCRKTVKQNADANALAENCSKPAPILSPTALLLRKTKNNSSFFFSRCVCLLSRQKSNLPLDDTKNICYNRIGTKNNCDTV